MNYLTIGLAISWRWIGGMTFGWNKVLLSMFHAIVWKCSRINSAFKEKHYSNHPMPILDSTQLKATKKTIEIKQPTL